MRTGEEGSRNHFLNADEMEEDPECFDEDDVGALGQGPLLGSIRILVPRLNEIRMGTMEWLLEYQRRRHLQVRFNPRGVVCRRGEDRGFVPGPNSWDGGLPSCDMGPLMRDSKNKICRDTEMIALMDDDDGMELLVNGNIITLSLTVRDVYDRLGKRAHIVYRMLVTSFASPR